MLGIKQNEESKRSGDSWIGPAPWIETPVPGPIAKALVQRDEQWSSTSYTRDYPLVVKRAKGSVIEDVDGNRFLDFAAGIAVCATGHCHPKVVKAIEEQANSLIHICGSDFYYPPMVELMERLAALAPGRHAKRVFLTNSGPTGSSAAWATELPWAISNGSSRRGALPASGPTASTGRSMKPVVPFRRSSRSRPTARATIA